MNICVTGAAGFFASHLIPRLLSAGHTVRGIDLVSPRSTEFWRTQDFRAHPNFIYIWGDAADRALDPAPDVLIHLASVTDVQFSRWSPTYTYEQISALALRVAKEAERGKVSHFIHFSTHSVYGRQRMPVKEDAPLLAQTSYGAAKIGAEAAIRAIGAERGLPYTVVRPSLMYGERERPSQLVSTFLRLAADNADITLDGGGVQTRDMNYAGNVVDGVMAIIDRGPTQDAYNLGSGEEVTIRRLAEMAVTAMGGGVLQDRPARPGEEGRLALDSGKAAKDLGYRPRVKFAEGFREVVKWYKGQQAQ